LFTHIRTVINGVENERPELAKSPNGRRQTYANSHADSINAYQ